MTRRLSLSCALWPPALAAWAMSLLAGASIRAAEPSQSAAWELWPYRIHVVASVETGDRLAGNFEQELPAVLKSRAAQVAGGSWKLEVDSAPAELRRAIVHDLPSIDEKSLTPLATKFDKVILLGIRPSAGGFQIRAREYDVVTSLWNSTVSLDVPQAELLPHEAFRAVWTALAPLARIEKVEGELITLRLRAGALVPRDKPLPLPPGAAFRPVLVESDASGPFAPGKSTLIEWTFLTATESSGSGVTCRLHTGLKSPVIPDYHPQRQRWAIGVSPSSSGTTLRLVSRGNDAEPLEGCDVWAEEPPSSGAAAKPVAIGRSNRRGEVLVPAGPQAVRTVVIRHGDDVLARVPIVPGLVEELPLALAFDRKRLEFESALDQLADDLIDAAARREVLAERIRAAEQAGQTQDAAKLRDQLRDAGSADALLARLDKLQQSVQTAGDATRRHLEPKLAELRRTIEQLQAKPAAK